MLDNVWEEWEYDDGENIVTQYSTEIDGVTVLWDEWKSFEFFSDDANDVTYKNSITVESGIELCSVEAMDFAKNIVFEMFRDGSFIEPNMKGKFISYV